MMTFALHVDFFYFCVIKSMEFSILGIPPTSAPSDVRRALRHIRAKYHPDKIGPSEAGQRLVQLAEEAYEVVMNKHRVNEVLNPLRTVARISDMLPRFNSEDSTYTSSYSYSNVNGVVHESGHVNGRPMNEAELERSRGGGRSQILEWR